MPMTYKTIWKRGDQTELARRAGISPQYLNDLIHARSRALPELAKVLEREAKILGYKLTVNDWIFPTESSSNLMG